MAIIRYSAPIPSVTYIRKEAIPPKNKVLNQSDEALIYTNLALQAH